MTNKQAIEQLKSLRAHCESMIDDDDRENPWRKDVKALEIAMNSIEREEHLEEIIKKERKENSQFAIMLIIFAVITSIAIILGELL